jgi:DNA mismatch repair protein MutS2
MGTGTAPEEGAALAVALLDEFRARESFVLATTHHDRLKAWASTTPGVVNAAVEFDDVNLRPTYRLLVGVPGGSSGIAIARRLGLAAEIVDRARTLLAPESREAADLIAYLHRSREELDRMRRQMAADRRALEEDREKLRTEWVDRQQKRIRELEAQFAEMHKRFEENVARVVEAVKERELRASLEKSSRRKLQEIRGEAREELNAALVQAISESQLDLSVSAAASGAVDVHALGNGARIRVRGFARPVIFRRLDGSSAEVEAGPLRMKVALDEIVGIEQPPAPAETPRRGNISVSTASSRAGGNFSSALASESSSVRSVASGKTASGEISVIGLTVEQATELVDKFLDDAALAHLPSVRIIHGHGTGALRRGLGDFLESHPLVAAHSFESDERGGKAVTVVQLRP